MAVVRHEWVPQEAPKPPMPWLNRYSISLAIGVAALVFWFLKLTAK